MAVADQVMALVEVVQGMATPMRMGAAGGALLVALFLKLFAGGFFGFLLRLGVFAGAAWWLHKQPEMQAVYTGRKLWVAAGGAAVLGLWLPSSILGFVLAALFGGRRAAEIEAPDLSTAPQRGIYSADYNKEEHRQVQTLMMTDIVGYSKKMSNDEQGTYDLLKEHNAIMRKNIKACGGTEIKTIGDAFMVRFNTGMDAVRCAIAVQKEFRVYNAKRMLHEHITIRIGINTGEMIMTKNDAFGEGVNIAARLEPQCDPGGIVISKTVYDECKNRIQAGFQSMGVRPLKNIKDPPEIFRVTFDTPGEQKVVSLKV
ncbi:MAG: adenylate/guanylate cyclase domain-containing protein [Alphaproteobacteria bacterium]|nr:adenylate/guanylate cyclase domain-containing protein [Alphaproteobacteria bacterium]